MITPYGDPPTPLGFGHLILVLMPPNNPIPDPGENEPYQSSGSILSGKIGLEWCECYKNFVENAIQNEQLR